MGLVCRGGAVGRVKRRGCRGERAPHSSGRRRVQCALPCPALPCRPLDREPCVSPLPGQRPAGGLGRAPGAERGARGVQAGRGPHLAAGELCCWRRRREAHRPGNSWMQPCAVVCRVLARASAFARHGLRMHRRPFVTFRPLFPPSLTPSPPPPCPTQDPLSIEETAERFVRPPLRQAFVDLCRGSVGAYLGRFGFKSELLQVRARGPGRVDQAHTRTAGKAWMHMHSCRRLSACTAQADACSAWAGVEEGCWQAVRHARIVSLTLWCSAAPSAPWRRPCMRRLMGSLGSTAAGTRPALA